MSSGERQRLQEEQLKNEIVELRGELGDTVEALVHKADLPARAKERGAELTERAVDRGAELHQQAVKRGSELSAQVVEWCTKFTAQTAGWGSDVRDQAVSATERAREAVYQAPADRWIKLASAGLALVATVIVLRRIRTS
ncbi:MAG: DUF3618 domain-containing protein [Pseudonocardiaceae bacterium]